jgi:hypothetical protein
VGGAPSSTGSFHNFFAQINPFSPSVLSSPVASASGRVERLVAGVDFEMEI